jgi:hypothetical protein
MCVQVVRLDGSMLHMLLYSDNYEWLSVVSVGTQLHKAAGKIGISVKALDRFCWR